MLSVENNELLTRVGPGTPMGMLMRHYWQPVCAVDELLRSPFRTKEVKILGEELVVDLPPGHEERADVRKQDLARLAERAFELVEGFGEESHGVGKPQ